VALLLLASDLHIGRASALPETVSGGAADTAAAAWERLVDLALQRRVAAVCLAGDVVDRENAFWEAQGVLERGIARLADAGIVTVAVAGNHDHAVLARLADTLPPEHFMLLGRGGRWEAMTLHHAGRPLLRLHGWSFPQWRVTTSPLAGYNLAGDAADLPLLGLVHGDLDDPASLYGPLDVAALRRLPPRGWVVGHRHRPRLDAPGGAPWVLCPGSVQALDPGETGVHGAWLLTVEGGTLSPPEPVPLSTVCYETIRPDLSGCADGDAVRVSVLDALRRLREEAVAAGGDALRVVVARVALAGRSPAAAAVPEVTAEMARYRQEGAGGVTLVVERVTGTVLPPVDLAELARATTPPAELARLLLALEQDELDDDQRALLQAVATAVRDELATPEYEATGDPAFDPAATRTLLHDAAERLLARLLEAQP